MQLRHLPTIDARYWTAILFASLFGTNLGDLYAHDSGLGLGLGLLVLLGLFVATYAVELRDRRSHEAYYWLAIIIIRTGATNIADVLAFRVRIPQLVLSLALAALVAALAWRRSPMQGGLDGSAGRKHIRLAYWGAMLGAGVFGTVVGDVCSHAFGQGPSALVLIALLAGALGLLRDRASATALSYWSVLMLARTAGTCAGDWLAETKLLHLGLPLSTLLTGAGFTAILIFWRTRRRTPPVAA
jgi:uncharacterized membrane-anchored protein